MSTTANNIDEEDVIGHTDDLYWTLNMVSRYLDDILTHIYGVDCEECLWGTDENENPAFQFAVPDNEDNNIRLEQFFSDFANVPSSLQRNWNPENKIIGFNSVDDIVPFLEHFSTYKNWGLNIPLEDYVAQIPKPDNLDSLFENITEPPDCSVLFLRKNAYSGFKACLPEIKAAFTAARYNLPHTKFTFTLDEISRSLNAFYAKQSGSKTHSTNDVLWLN